MNKIFYILTAITFSIIASCSSPREYKFQDQADVSNCSGIDEDLLKEAFYSFEDDLETFYDYGKFRKGSEMSLQYAYSNFAYTGARGEADYNNISSAHTMKIYNWLKTETNLYIGKNDTLRLNYSHPFVVCIIDNIQNETIKTTIQDLVGVNSMSSNIIASPLRRNYIDAMTDKNFAMYMALDSYYKYLGLKSKALTRPPAKKHKDHNH